MKANGTMPPDTVGQFEIALKSIDTCLRHAGGKPDQVIKVLVFMTDITERASINPIRQRYFGDHRPASTLVEVTALVDTHEGGNRSGGLRRRLDHEPAGSRRSGRS